MVYRAKQTQGFTLIELSIVLTILSILLGVGLGIGTTQIVLVKQKETKRRMEVINRAIENYVEIYHRLPCPADITDQLTDSVNFGKERSQNYDNKPYACDDSGAGVFRTVGADPSDNLDPDNKVVWGMLPVATLQLPDYMAFDGWGRRFVYAMDEVTTVPESLNEAGPDPLFDNNTYRGGIRIGTVGGNKVLANDLVADPKAPLENVGAIVMVLSYGEDGHGAWFKQGGTARNVADSPDAIDLVNCHCDAAGTMNSTENYFISVADAHNDVAMNRQDYMTHFSLFHFAK